MKGAIGVDGGKSGAIAYVNDVGGLSVCDMPLAETKNGRTVLDHAAYLHILRDFTFGPTGLREETFGRWADLALLERGGDIPFVGNDGRRRHQSGMYEYGFHNGALFMGAVAVGVPAQIVEPQVWKRALHLLGKDKEASRARAGELYPAYAHLWKNKGHHNRAEAVLIAHYALHHL